jgi:drug/metabolite transporter (DMT)-like permease
MPAILLGVVAATSASALYSVGIAVQALDARLAPPEERLRLALAARLVRRARWLAGTGLTILGWPLQLVALLWASIVVVQPALAAGLLLLLALSARILGEPPRRRDVVATVAIVVGIAVLAVAAPAPSHEHAHGAPLALALTALALLALAPYLLDRLGHGHVTVTVTGAGVGYATGGVTTALTADALHRGAWLEALAWAVATGLASGSGLLSEMSALQERPAIHVAPVVFTIQTVVPVALAPWLLHATLSDPGQLPAVAAGLALVVAGSWALSRSTAVLGLTGEPAGAG